MFNSSTSRDRLWDEYKYRHGHLWKTVFQLTLAVVAIGAAPYANPALACSLGPGLLLLPGVAVSLCAFAQLRVQRELAVLDWVKERHREEQGSAEDLGKGEFAWQMKTYVAALLLLSLANGVVLVDRWLPVAAAQCAH